MNRMRYFKRCGIFLAGLAVSFAIFVFWGCMAQPPASEPVASSRTAGLAVWDMTYSGPPGAPEAQWGELLSSAVIETFQEDDRYEVVERQQLLLALQELNLGTSDLVDDTVRLRLGEIVGARYMVFGNYFIIGGAMRLDMRLVAVETGRVVTAAEQTVPDVDLIKAMTVAKAAARVLRQS